jgi:hypothetical protein
VAKAARTAKAARSAKAKRGEAQYTWKVTRRNNESMNVTAATLTVQDGDLVFLTNDVAVRVMAADTYSDVELVGPANA